jgi:hypothetical protein
MQEVAGVVDGHMPEELGFGPDSQLTTLTNYTYCLGGD